MAKHQASTSVALPAFKHMFSSSAERTWMLPMTPVDSILLATLTVLPQMS